MSNSIDTSFVVQYEREVHEAFQRKGSKLLNTVRWKRNVVGSSTTFQVVGKGTATTKARHGVITPMNQDHTAVSCALSQFYAGDWYDKLDETFVNIDERMVIANGGAYALGRKIDDQITTALDGTSQTVITWTLTSQAAIRNALLGMAQALDSNDVPDDGDRFGVLTPKAWSFAMTVPEFASSDFVAGDQPYANGYMEWRNWMGVKWCKHSGLPGAGTASAKVFVYHRTAVGYASGTEIMADISWHGDRAAHFINHMMSGGSTLIEDEGVIEGSINDTTALPTS